MSSPVRAVVLIRTKPGTRDQQLAAFAALAPVVRAEAGCVTYDLHEVVGEPERFVLLEHWESQEALDTHDASAHMAAAGEGNAAFRAGPAEVLLLAAEPVA